ncbi:hypothetical protein SDC9_66653 [bioreactor metagenome]|uniref:Uncharacterized protein n=1 Tax=bioreactor metagenome TaxID=1076179 RepID=A0A644Y1X9_9ZZZZ
MKLNGFAFDKFGLESLNTEAVKGRSTVEHNRMSFEYILENVPNDRILAVNNFLG